MKIWRCSTIFLSFVIISCSGASSSRNAASSGRIQAQICEDLTAMRDPHVSEADLRTELQDKNPNYQIDLACHQRVADRNSFGLKALEVYILNYYSGGHFYWKLNKALWENNCAQYLNASRILASAINKIPARRGTVYRGINASAGELAAQFKVGGVYQSPAFMSTSLKPDVAVNFAKNAILEIRNGAGGYLADYGSHSNEMEVLLVPGTTFSVDSIETVALRGRSFQLVKMTQLKTPLNSVIENQEVYMRPSWRASVPVN